MCQRTNQPILCTVLFACNLQTIIALLACLAAAAQGGNWQQVTCSLGQGGEAPMIGLPPTVATTVSPTDCAMHRAAVTHLEKHGCMHAIMKTCHYDSITSLSCVVKVEWLPLRSALIHTPLPLLCCSRPGRLPGAALCAHRAACWPALQDS